MKRLAVATATLLLLAAAGLAGWSALASHTSASADVWHTRGAGADAVFVTTDECTRVETWISAGSWVDQIPPGKPTEGKGLMVSIDVWDSCLYPGVVGRLADPVDWGEWPDPYEHQTYVPEDAELTASYWGWTNGADVDITPSDASASGVVTVCDVALPEMCADLDISVDWDVAGGVSVSASHGHDPICNSHNHFGSREAMATGTMRQLLPGVGPLPNLIPDPAVYATVGVWQSGVVCKA